MRPLGQGLRPGSSPGLSRLDDGTAEFASMRVIGSEANEAPRDRVSDDGLAEAPRFAPDTQYAQRGPLRRSGAIRRVGPDGRALSDPEVFRLELYEVKRSQLEEIDPGNLELQRQYLNGPGGFLPTDAEVDALVRALQDARSVRPTLQGPVRTFDNLGRPVGGDLRNAMEREIQNTQFTGGKIVGDIGSPRAIANPDPTLGPNQVRYQVRFADEFGKITEYSVNYDFVTDRFGIIKPASEPAKRR